MNYWNTIWLASHTVSQNKIQIISDKLFPTYSDFSMILSNKLAAIGLDTSHYTSHSLRRGGASFAHQCGAKPESIQKMGDWASLCVLLYLDTPLSHRHNVAQTMANNI